jgi:hypothetical protein
MATGNEDGEVEWEVTTSSSMARDLAVGEGREFGDISRMREWGIR